MTFPDMCSACESSFEKSNLTIGQALERCLSRAVATQRVTVGIQECAKLLGCAPERVLLCVIPDMSASADVGLHIQHTLVRSFCWENDLRLLTVKNCEKLQNLLNLARAGRVEGTSDPADLSPPSCLLVEVPKDEVSGEEDFVCDYHDTVICSHIYPKPVIQLPV